MEELKKWIKIQKEWAVLWSELKGFVGIDPYGIQVTEELFKEIVSELNLKVKEEEERESEYKYSYEAEIDGSRIFCISKRRIRFKKEKRNE